MSFIICDEELVTVEPTNNLKLVKLTMTDETLYDLITDDFSPTVEEFEPSAHPDVVYLLCRDWDKNPFGLFMLVPRNGIELQVHNYLLPSSRGPKAQEAARQALKWIWTYTCYLRIIGVTPSYNRRALKFATDVGMKQFGVDKRSLMKNGKLYDQIYTGISKPVDIEEGEFHGN